MKFAHVNIVARDWERLAKFYIDVFGCTPVPPERDLKGLWIDDLTGIGGVAIKGIHLRLPGFDGNGPTLEIFQYKGEVTCYGSSVNHKGFAHIAFAVDDVETMLKTVTKAGGASVGKCVTVPIENVGMLTVVYASDPEGNVVELQHWHDKSA